MKFKSVLSAGLLAAFSTLSLGIHAADGDPAEVKAPAADVKSEKPKKKMKPHSHVEEKGGAAPLKSPEAGSGQSDAEKSDAEKTNAGKDPKKHYHPRDGK